MANDQLEISFGGWVSSYFVPDIESYCDILLNRINPIFLDLEGEQQRAFETFMSGASSWFQDESDAVEAAYEHAQEHVLQFWEMGAVFLATGVSGLFHLFEKQLYRHFNKELRDWIVGSISQWREIESMIPKYDHKFGIDDKCLELSEVFNNPDLQELMLVANAVKHGDDGGSYKKLLARNAVVVSKDRLESDGAAGPYSTLRVSLSVHPSDVERYRDALIRFWKLDGTFYAPRTAFK